MELKWKHLILLIITSLLSACDDTYTSAIPDYPVYLELNLTATYPTFKNSSNKYLIFDKKINVYDYIGYGGILVYTGFDGSYYAFDLSCPYEHKQNTKVKPNDIGKAVCDSCKTVFDISYGIGNPESGPAKQTLRRYKAILSGDKLIISR